MLDAGDPDLWRDEISMLTYLASMMETLPEAVPQPDPARASDDWLGRHGDAGDAFLQKVNVRGPGMAKAASLFGLGAGVVPVAEEDVAVVDDVACGALGCGLAD